MSRNRFLTFPNALSVVAIAAGGLALYYGLVSQLDAVVLLLASGGGACAFDGWVAERYNQRTKFGDEVLQPVAGLSLGVAAIVTLCWNDYWPDWLGWALFGYFALLQVIDLLAQWWPKLVNALRNGWKKRWRYMLYVVAYNIGQGIRRAKRHQFWLHPTSSIVVTFVAATHMAIAAWGYPVQMIIMGGGLLGLLALLRYERLLFWLAGPQPGR